MNVNDRGTMKWTSIMLPEHVEALKKLWEEQNYKEMPILDEHQIAENNLSLQEALENDLQVSIKYFADHDHKIATGHLLYIDALNKRLFIDDVEIKLHNLIEVKITQEGFNLLSVPKPSKSKRKNVSNKPVMTEDKMMEIAEKLGEALEFKNEVKITTYQHGKYEEFKGVIQAADPNTKMITFQEGFNQLKISANIIVDIE